LERGRPEKALSILGPLADVLPKITSVRIWLARVALANLDPVTAAEAIRAEDVDRMPDVRRHFCRLARLNLRMENFDAAARYLQLAQDADSASGRVWSVRGAYSMATNDVDEAVECYRRQADCAVSDDEKENVLQVIGHTFAAAGRRSDAAEAFRKSIDQKPSAGAYYGLVDAQEEINADHPIIDTVRQLLADPAVVEKEPLHFAMALAHSRSGNAADAFSHFALGNMLAAPRFANHYFNPRRELKETQEVFSESMIAKLSQHGCDEDFLICIVGMPRSGTTLMEQIVSSHSQVRGLGERGDFVGAGQRLARQLKHKGGYPLCCKRLSPGIVERESRLVHSRLRQLSGESSRCVTKRPADVWDLGLIKILFPNVKIIHMQRDPVDTCWSCFMQNFAQIGYATSLSTLATEYRCYRKVIRFWHDALPKSSILDVSYETLVAEPETTVRSVLDFCGLPFEENCLAYHEKRDPVFTASQYQVRKPIYKSSVRRSDPYREYLAVLLGLDKESIAEESPSPDGITDDADRESPAATDPSHSGEGSPSMASATD
jgi:hypothetical protein